MKVKQNINKTFIILRTATKKIRTKENKSSIRFKFKMVKNI